MGTEKPSLMGANEGPYVYTRSVALFQPRNVLVSKPVVQVRGHDGCLCVAGAEECCGQGGQQMVCWRDKWRWSSLCELVGSRSKQGVLGGVTGLALRS